MSEDRLRNVETTLATLTTELRLNTEHTKEFQNEIKDHSKQVATAVSELYSRQGVTEDIIERRGKWGMAGSLAIFGLMGKVIMDLFSNGTH